MINSKPCKKRCFLPTLESNFFSQQSLFGSLGALWSTGHLKADGLRVECWDGQCRWSSALRISSVPPAFNFTFSVFISLLQCGWITAPEYSNQQCCLLYRNKSKHSLILLLEHSNSTVCIFSDGRFIFSAERNGHVCPRCIQYLDLVHEFPDAFFNLWCFLDGGVEDLRWWPIHYSHLYEKVVYALARFKRTRRAGGKQILAQCPKCMCLAGKLSSIAFYPSLYHKLSISICRSSLPVKGL